jgi:endoglucanase
VDPGNPLFTEAKVLLAQDQAPEAAQLLALAQTPAALWASGQPDEMEQVQQETLAADSAHQVPVVVAYNLPDRDACGRYSANGGTDAAGYMTWINQLAAAIGDGDDFVIVEPDAVPDIVNGCLSPAQVAQRYQLLRYAMSRLGALPHAQVYLDAGNPGMFSNPGALVAPLRQAGISFGRGFSANVSNFQWTGTVVSWSQQLERALGDGVQAVIDTSRNGNGPYYGPDYPQRCTPAPRGSARTCGSRTPASATGPATAGPPRASSGSAMPSGSPRRATPHEVRAGPPGRPVRRGRPGRPAGVPRRSRRCSAPGRPGPRRQVPAQARRTARRRSCCHSRR